MRAEDLRNVMSDFKKLRKLWPDLRDQKHLLFITMALVPFISFLQMAPPLILKQTIDEGILAGDEDAILTGTLLFLALIFGQYLVRLAQSLTSLFAVHRLIASLRMRLVRHIIALSATFHDHTISGALVTRSTSDFDNLSESLNQGILTAVVDIAVLGGVIFGLFILNWQLAVFTICFLPVLALLTAWFSAALKKANLHARSKIAILNGFAQECLYGNATVKLLGAENVAQEKYDRLTMDYRDAQMKTVLLDSMLFSVMDGIASVAVGMVLWYIVTQLLGVATLTAGVLVAFVLYIQQLFDPLKHLSSKLALLQGMFAAMDRIFGLLDVHEFVEGSSPPPPLQGSIVFRDVHFSYKKSDGEEVHALNGVSFELAAGQSLALVGRTGGGKSTVVRLLAKLYDGYAGQILVDGRNLGELDGGLLRREIAIVPQDIVLFDGTVRFNIGLERKGVGEADIRRAAQMVGADKFIEQLPGGYDFSIREKGGNLSQGQQQLLVFARALACDPKLVILDEATSSVDVHSEAVIQEAIDSILKDRTVVVIAHRLSTIRRCDRILVIQRGVIVEAGNHEELMGEEGVYYQLTNA